MASLGQPISYRRLEPLALPQLVAPLEERVNKVLLEVGVRVGQDGVAEGGQCRQDEHARLHNPRSAHEASWVTFLTWDRLTGLGHIFIALNLLLVKVKTLAHFSVGIDVFIKRSQKFNEFLNHLQVESDFVVVVLVVCIGI